MTNWTIPERGAIVAGGYQVERVLQIGGNTMTLVATHRTWSGRIVLELVWPAHIESHTVQTFLRDVRVASLMRSRHTARVIDAGALDDGGFYIAREFLDGESLASARAQRGSMIAHDAATYLVQICDAVGEAHVHGLVHRELVMSNLFVANGTAKVAGFASLAPLLDATHADDPRNDIFALGCVLFELVSGKSPFEMSIAAMRARCPYVPAGLVNVIARCLEPDPARRYQRACDLSTALAVFTAAEPHREAPRFTTANIVAVPSNPLD
jgi:serine/threonine-protein kinase